MLFHGFDVIEISTQNFGIFPGLLRISIDDEASIAARLGPSRHAYRNVLDAVAFVLDPYQLFMPTALYVNGRPGRPLLASVRVRLPGATGTGDDSPDISSAGPRAQRWDPTSRALAAGGVHEPGEMTFMRGSDEFLVNAKFCERDEYYRLIASYMFPNFPLREYPDVTADHYFSLVDAYHYLHFGESPFEAFVVRPMAEHGSDLQKRNSELVMLAASAEAITAQSGIDGAAEDWAAVEAVAGARDQARVNFENMVTMFRDGWRLFERFVCEVRSIEAMSFELRQTE